MNDAKKKRQTIIRERLRKSSMLNNEASLRINIPWTMDNKYEVSILESKIQGEGDLYLTLSVKLDGHEILDDNLFIFRNPPINIVQKDNTIVEDAQTALRILIDNVLRRKIK